MPDEVTDIFIEELGDSFCGVSWDAPCSNNYPIVQYNLYLSASAIRNVQVDGSLSQREVRGRKSLHFRKIGETNPDQRYFWIENLEANSANYLVITAVNKSGEGYKNKTPLMISTLKKTVKSLGSLYVWGSNGLN